MGVTLIISSELFQYIDCHVVCTIYNINREEIKKSMNEMKKMLKKHLKKKYILKKRIPQPFEGIKVMFKTEILLRMQFTVTTAVILMTMFSNK